MKKEMLINVLQPEECRIAIVEDGVLEELYVERASQESYVGNIYKGRIVNIEPSIQAVFVDFGIGRNGFLHVSDVDPVYFKHLLSRDQLAELEGDDGPPPPPRGDRRDQDRGRDRDRGGGRGDRRDRDRERPRSPRVTEPEAAVTIRDDVLLQPPPLPVEEETGFVEGLDDGFTPPPPPRIEQPPPQLRPERPRPAPVVRTETPPAEPSDDGDFGAGLVDYTPPPRQAGPEPTQEESETPPLVELAPEAPAELVEESPETIEKPAKGKGRSRTKKKSDDEGEAKEAETKAKGKPRRTKKKDDADGEATDAEEKPRPMPGEERRTTEDDEPEIKPLFDDGLSDDFDVEGSNDRFAASDDADEEEDEDESGFGGEYSSAIGLAKGDDTTEEEEEGDEDEATESADSRPEPDDDDEYAPPVRQAFNNEEAGPDRGRPRGRGRGRPRPGGDRGPPSRTGPRDRTFPRPPIQEIFKRGQEVIVQVIKEGIGTKGPTLSTFVSIAGRYLVLMPSLNRVGVSRKIEDHDARKRLREIMTKLNPPQGVGFIVRTAAVDRNETELRNDLAYLLRLWQVVARRIKKVAAPVEIYRESDMITRTIRDIFTNDIDTIWVDEANAFAHASEFLQIVMPRFASRIRYFDNTEPLFQKYGIEDDLMRINQKRIDLPQGGSIIIEQTEALVAIDVNSGTFRADNRDAEETAFRMNMLAAREIARQLRLRDLGGVIVNDFIDMRDLEHRRKVEDAMRDALQRDRARTKILRISQFGIIEMTRQRIQPSLKKRVYNDCSHCKGTGYIKTQETMGIEVMRLLQLGAHRSPAVTSITLMVHIEVAFYLLNRKRKEIASLEERAKMEVQVNGVTAVSPDHLEFRCLDSNGNEVRLYGGPPPRVFRPAQGQREPERRYPRQLD